MLKQHIDDILHFCFLNASTLLLFFFGVDDIVIALARGVHNLIFYNILKNTIDYNTIMLNYKQLYQTNPFELPEPAPIDLHPFPQHELEVSPDATRDLHVRQLFKG